VLTNPVRAAALVDLMPTGLGRRPLSPPG